MTSSAKMSPLSRLLEELSILWKFFLFSLRCVAKRLKYWAWPEERKRDMEMR